MRETWERRGKIRLGSPWSDLNPSICPAANTITSTSTSAQEIRGIAGSLTPKRGTNLVETELRYVTTRAVILSYSSPPFLLYFLFFFLFFFFDGDFLFSFIERPRLRPIENQLKGNDGARETYPLVIRFTSQ